MHPITKLALVTLLKLIFLVSADSTVQSSTVGSFNKQVESTIEVFKTLHKKYGEARLILKDKSIYKRIRVHEVNSLWIVFLKNGSLHDMLIEKIARIQYGQGIGPIVTFNSDNKIVVRY